MLPFLEFVEHHPAGTSVEAVVDSYSSHGAYVDIVDSNVRGYVPLRMMAERENAKEKAMQRAMPRRGLVQEMARADVDPAPVIDVADSGPRPRST